MCRVSTVTPTVFSYNWVAFLKSSSSFDFEQWKKRSQRKTEIVIDGRSICHSWQCFQLAFMVTWKLTFSACTIRAGQYKRTVLLISLFKYIRWFSNNQFLIVLSLLYGFVQIEITEKASLRFWLRVVSYFSFGHGRMRERASGKRQAASGEAARKEGWLIYFSPYIGVLVLVFLLSSVLFHNHQILMASLAFFFLKHCTLLPTTLEMGKINNWTYFYRKCPAENAGNGISETLD